MNVGESESRPNCEDATRLGEVCVGAEPMSLLSGVEPRRLGHIPRTSVYRRNGDLRRRGLVSGCAKGSNLRSAGDDIGVVLRADGGRVDLVLAAIRDDNSGVALYVVDHGDIVEVSAHRRLRVTEQSLRWHVGCDFGTHDLRSMMVSFHGTLTATTDCMTVTYSGPKAA